MQHTNTRTLGPVSSRLITELKRGGKGIFRLKDASAILKKGVNATADLLSELVKRGVISRLKAGLFLIVPLEAGRGYMENWYVVARELIQPRPYYISYYSAMALHGFTAQPILKVFISSSARRKNRKISGIEFYFFYARPSSFFGLQDEWITKQEKVKVSDLERTIIDALLRPELCGGISEIARGIWMRRQSINYQRLLKYCRKSGVKAVAKRLGFILEALNLTDNAILPELKRYAIKSRTYVPLDPTLKKQGKYTSHWRLLVNCNPEELRSIIWG